MENKYFTELAHRLQAAGITTGHPERNQLTVLLNDQPVLFVSSESDVFLLPAGSNPPEASELYHKVAQTAEEVYAYASPFTDRNDCCMSYHSNPARDLVIREAVPIFVVLSQKNRGCK